MKKIKEKSFAKRISVFVLIFMMLFSYFVPIISWATENNANEDENVVFDITWGEDGTKTVYAGDKYGATFSLALSGVQTGFSNLKIQVEDEQTPKATIDAKSANKDNTLVNAGKSNSKTLVFKDKVDSGVSTGGTVFFTFKGANDYEDYQKNIKVILTGEYVDSKSAETKYICIEKTLTSNVKTRDTVDAFESSIELGSGKNRDDFISTTRSNDGLIGGEFVTTGITVKSQFNIQGHNVTYGTYKMNVKRETDGYDSKIINDGENCDVSVFNLPDYMTSSTSRNEDGSIDLIISVGEEKEEYSEEEMFNFSENIRIQLIYRIIEDTSAESTNTNLHFEYTGNAKGYTVTKGKNGTQYTEENDSFTNQYDQTVALSYYSGDYKATAKIEGHGRTKTEWEENIQSGNTDFVWTTDTLYWDRRAKSLVYYDFKNGGSHFYSWLIDVTNYSCVKYMGDDGTEKEINVGDALLLKSIEIKNWNDSWESLNFYSIDGVNGDWNSEVANIEDSPIFFKAKGNNLRYTVPEGQTITNYGAIIGNVLYSLDDEQNPEWETVYTLNKERLTRAGLSENEIKNVISVSKTYSYSMANTNNMNNITYPGMIKSDDKLENTSKQGDYDFVYSTNISEVERSIFNKSKFEVYGYRDGFNTNLKYTSDEGNQETLDLTDELKLKSIEVRGYDGSWEYADFYKRGETEPFFRAEAGNLEYYVPEGEVITDYYVIFDYMYGERLHDNSYPKWDATYTLDIDKLKENLSDEEIKNISSITRYQEGKFDSCDNSNYSAACYINVPSQAIKYSNFYVISNDMDTNVGAYGVSSQGSITLVMNKDKENEKVKSVSLENKNPKFFVQLPDCYDYENISVSISSTTGSMVISNKGCTDEDESAWYIDYENKMLVINCYGDWKNEYGATYVTINFDKKLNTYAFNTNNRIYAYMITDNGNYVCNKIANTKSLSKNGNVPTYIEEESTAFTIEAEDIVRIRNGIIVNDNTIYPTETSDTKLSTKNNPIKVKAGNTVTYKTEIAANDSVLTNVSVLSKLPIANNKSIHGTIYSLGSENTLTNLSNIRATYRNGTIERELNSSDYTIKYNTEQDVNFDSTWTDYVEGDTGINDAQAILVVLSDNYKINRNGFLSVYFDMTVPETEGISGQISAVKYTKSTEVAPTILEPAPVYVEKGNPDGTLNVQKVFQGYNVGVAPTGVSLKDIEFKIKDVKTGEALVIDGQTNNEGIIKTNETGSFTLTNIPRGRYEIVEVSKIDGFEGIDYTAFEITNSETIDKTVTNKRKIVDITIQKTWEFTDLVQQGSVKLRVQSSENGMNFSRIVTTDAQTGKVTLSVPCGKYNIVEQEGLSGWCMYMPTMPIEVTEDNKTYTVFNYIPRCGFTINKTVPNVEGSTDTVDGITFRIKGTAYAGSYIDENGEEQYLDFDKTVTIGEDTEGVTQTISDDHKQVTIELPSVYAGNYTVTEIDMPKIEVDGEQINRYADLVRSISLQASSGNQLNLENIWKRGKVKINKTAEEGVELDQFKFRVYGTSYYGTQVDRVITIDANGKGSADIVIGNYRVEEVGTDAFNTVFEITENGVKRDQANYQDIKVTGSNIVSIDVRNETAYGYVKIEKTLEGKDNPSSAQGIQFVLSGIAPSGENISKTITIGSDGTGISEAIPAGGEYVLNEVESTVPNNYELMDERAVQISKYNTEENPLVINVENKRGKGKLEITTETNPSNGDVYPIVYNVQEIIVNDEDGSYTRIENTEKTVNGDLYGKAVINDLPAGTYIVSQKSIPTGWRKDIPQIIDIPMDNTAYAIFLIDREEEQLNSRVTISKTILNPDGEQATENDFTKYKLDKNQSFEVKLVNKVSGKEYYVFTNPEVAGVIEGLPEGTYKIEESFKQKYLFNSYSLIGNGEKSKIEATNGEYLFEIGNEADGKNIVSIEIENKINDKFGFGGQSSKDNMSKMDVETVENTAVTRSVLYVVDEDGNKIEGCTFEIYDSANKKVSVISPTTKQTTIKGLDAGVYTVKNVLVPNGYLLCDDIALVVYNDAVRTVRFEIQKNIPRGNLTIQTVYTDSNNKTRNVPKSQYMIVDSQTGEVVKFEKKADGSYKKSNLSNATDKISVRAGKVTLRGVETGNYEVGLVGLSEGYGLIKTDDVEIAEVVKDETQDITVQTVQKEIVDIQSVNEDTYILDNTGVLWAWGINNDNYALGNDKKVTQGEPTIIMENVNKMSMSNYGRAVIDNDGELYVWGKNEWGILGIDSSDTSIVVRAPQHVELAYSDGTKVKAKEVSSGQYSTLVIDENNKLWYAGYKSAIGFGHDYVNNMSSDVYKFTCITDMEESPFAGIIPTTVYCGYTANYLLDDDGKLWSWSAGYTDRLGYIPTQGTQAYMATCISLTPGRSGNDIYEAYKQGIKITQIHDGLAIDENGDLYTYNQNNSLAGPYAYCLTKEGRKYAGKKFIKAVGIHVSNEGRQCGKYALIDSNNKLYLDVEREGSVSVNDIEQSKYADTKFTNVTVGYNALTAVDSNNKLYGEGYLYGSYGQYGASQYTQDIQSTINGIKLMEYQTTLPNYCAYFKYDMKFQKVASCRNVTIALDDDGNIWTWGENSSYNRTGNGIGYVTTPRRVEMHEDIKFKDIAVDQYSEDAMYVIDTQGRLWTWGYTSSQLSGTGMSNFYLAKTCVSELVETSNPLAIAYSEGIKLEEIDSQCNLMIARDNHNKTWIWGPGAVPIVPDRTNITVPYCLGNDEALQEFYASGKYIKKATLFYGTLAFIDNEGMLWYYNRDGLYSVYYYNLSNSATELENEIINNKLKIVDLTGFDNTGRSGSSSGSYLELVDELGRVWCKSTPVSSSCYSTIEGSTMATEYSSGVKFVSLNSYEDYYLGIDNQGHIWKNMNSENPQIVADDTQFTYAASYQYNSYFAIDTNGHMWVWGNNYNYRLGTGTTADITSPTKTTQSPENNMYGMKFIDVNSTGVESDEGYMYYINSNEVRKGTQTLTYLTNQGIEIKQHEGNYAIDTEGKLYYLSSWYGKWDYITDTEGNDLNSAYYNSNIGIKQIICTKPKTPYWTSDKYYFVGSNGKLYDSDYKLCGDFVFEKMVSITTSNCIVTDSDGNYWINGSNYNGLLGNGDLSVTVSNEFIKINLGEDVKISEILFFDEYVIYVKDTNGIIWAWGNNHKAQVGAPKSIPIVSTPYCWDVQVDKIFVKYFYGYTDSDANSKPHAVLVLDTDGYVWSAGYGAESSDFSDGLAGKSNYELGKVDNSASMGKIVKLQVSVDCAYAINEDGDMWVWGANSYGALGYTTQLREWFVNSSNTISYYTFTAVRSPVCLTNTQGTFYGKKIKEVIDTTGYSYYVDETYNTVSKAGTASVLVITEDGEAYGMGSSNRVVDSYADDMYTNSNTQYPTPILAEIDGSIEDVYKCILKTDTGKIYYVVNVRLIKDITKDEYVNMTLEEINEDYKSLGNNESTDGVTIDKENHTITYKSGSNVVVYEYPENINPLKAYANSGNAYIIDENNDLWIKGSATGRGYVFDTFRCITKEQFSGESIWNKIRGRWNLINRKY